VIPLLRRVHSKLCAKGGAIQKVLAMAGSVQQMAERRFSAGATLRPHFDVPPHEALPGAFQGSLQGCRAVLQHSVGGPVRLGK